MLQCAIGKLGTLLIGSLHDWCSARTLKFACSSFLMLCPPLVVHLNPASGFFDSLLCLSSSCFQWSLSTLDAAKQFELQVIIAALYIYTLIQWRQSSFFRKVSAAVPHLVYLPADPRYPSVQVSSHDEQHRLSALCAPAQNDGREEQAGQRCMSRRSVTQLCPLLSGCS